VTPRFASLLPVGLVVGACSFTHGALPDNGSDGAIDVPSSGISSPRKLTFDNSASTVDFGPHPVLIALDASKIDYSVVANPKTDLRFEYATTGNIATIGDDVPFEVEHWDPTGESIVWIRVPEILRGSTDTTVLMHFGPNAGGAANADATFMNWHLVQHMSPGLVSSAGEYNGTAVNTTFEAGTIGNAAAFSGTGDQRITFANGGALFDQWGVFTLIFWLYVDYANAGEIANEPRVMDKGGSLGQGKLINVNNEINFQLAFHFTGTNNDFFPRIVVSPRTWTMISYSFDGYGLNVMKNGVSEGIVDLGGSQQTMLASNNAFELGDSSNAFKGRVDEIRIERRYRLVDFFRAQHLNMTRQFVTFSDP
jgi:hypothetical protein